MIPDFWDWIGAAVLAFFSPLVDETWLQVVLLLAIGAFIVYWRQYREIQRSIQ